MSYITIRTYNKYRGYIIILRDILPPTLIESSPLIYSTGIVPYYPSALILYRGNSIL